MTDAPTAMSAADVYEALLRKWPPSEYLSIREAPTDSDRQGRKLDLVILSLWRSRGLELDGVEVKVSLADWRRELKDAGKADWWWRHVNRFWIAVPATIAPKVKDELPESWGLLACTLDNTRVIVKPARHDREPLGWQSTVGLLRAAADAGSAALFRADQMGFDRGSAQTKARLERQGSDGVAEQKLVELRDRVRVFEEAAGFKISDGWDGPRIGEAVAIIRGLSFHPRQIGELEAQAVALERQAAMLRGTQEAVHGLMRHPETLPTE